MTCIATDGKSMAADGRACQNDIIVSEDQVKVSLAADGCLIGLSGVTALTLPFMEWWQAGAIGKCPYAEDVDALILKRDGSVLFIGTCGYPVVCNVPRAIGSGGPMAMIAMDAGLSPEEAVALVSERDPFSGGIITVLHLDEKLKAAA